MLSSTYPNKRVIVADNASTDGSVQMLAANFPTVEYIINDKNIGFAGGYNWALNGLESDYYVLLNSDVEVAPEWIEPIIQLMSADPFIGACQPKILQYKQKNKLEYAGAAGGWIDILGYPFSRGRIFDVLEEDENQYDTNQRVFWATGAALFIRGWLFHQVGGFDTDFFAHMEEIDLCWRVQLAGYAIYCCPKSVVYHVGAGTLPRGGRKVFLNFRNNLLMLSKNLTPAEKCWKLPLRFFLDAISAYKGLLQGDLYFFTAIFKAHFSVMGFWLRGLPKKTKVRKPLKSLHGVLGTSIVWLHFVKKKKKYSEIVKT